MAAFIIRDNWEKVYRTRCEVYTRVMGYFRPVSQFNPWKKSEFYNRIYFKEWKSANSNFIDCYACSQC